MNKSTKILLIAIGTLSIIAGIFNYLKKEDLTESMFALVIGISIIVTVFYGKKLNTCK
ncbi:hypothetical protein [Flagellimonas lutimaris]|uniref:hypothetical protein n=1 Tax=Flagellimonas lutimaris TaxID=475082 RepID=UPI0016043117|nr:hypothetical protein [Allomuricauda lutimaris]